jgi:hypothetical protein
VSLLLTAVAVYFAVAFGDGVWTMYLTNAAALRPHRAGVWAALIPVVGAVTVLAVVDDVRMIVPSALGGYTGTYLTVQWEKRKRG